MATAGRACPFAWEEHSRSPAGALLPSIQSATRSERPSALAWACALRFRAARDQSGTRASHTRQIDLSRWLRCGLGSLDVDPSAESQMRAKPTEGDGIAPQYDRTREQICRPFVRKNATARLLENRGVPGSSPGLAIAGCPAHSRYCRARATRRSHARVGVGSGVALRRMFSHLLRAFSYSGVRGSR
jgi:hypothetical protein